jgi:hypothetical protein
MYEIQNNKMSTATIKMTKPSTKQIQFEQLSKREWCQQCTAALKLFGEYDIFT